MARLLVALLALLVGTCATFGEPINPPGVRSGGSGVASGFSAAPPGGELRTFAARLADEINVRDLKAGVCTGNDAIDTAALNLAISKAALAPGSTIRLPACTYKLRVTAGTYGFRLPSDTTLRGDGARTVITWNDAEGTVTPGLYLFGPSDGPITVRTKNITIRDLTIRGSGDVNGITNAWPILLTLIDGLTIDNVTSEYSRIMGIAVQHATDVTVVNSRVAYSRSDGINVSKSAGVTVSANSVNSSDDDGIAVQSALDEPLGVRRNLVISDNRIFNGNGIRVGGARHASITGNQIDSVRSFGISVEDMPARQAADGTVLQEGELAPPQAVVVAGNVITNVLRRQAIDGADSGHAAINITGFSARAGTAGAIPGEPSATGVIKDPLFEFNANSGLTSTPTPGSVAILVANNVVARTLPPTNSKDPRYAKWSDLGQGQIWMRDGFHDPMLAEADMRPTGIYIFGGVTRDVLITGNILRGTSSPVSVGNGVRADVTVRGNRMADFTNAGLLMDTAGKNRVVLEANDFDADPYLLNTGRGAAGSWSSATGFPSAVFLFQASNVFVRGNSFRNMNNITNAWGNPGLFWAENYVEADIGTFGAFSTSNKGIGAVPENSARLRYVRVNSDPTSADFGKVITMPTYP